MSLLKTLQEYICEYSDMDIRPISEVLTDGTTEYPSSYALAPSGNGKTSQDILGNHTYQNSYVFYAKEHAANEVDRGENYDFLESFSSWLEERSENGDLPALPGRYCAESIEVHNAMLFDIDDNGIALYQVQIQLIFTKRRV